MIKVETEFEVSKGGFHIYYSKQSLYLYYPRGCCKLVISVGELKKLASCLQDTLTEYERSEALAKQISKVLKKGGIEI